MTDSSPDLDELDPDRDRDVSDGERWDRFKAAAGSYVREKWEEATDVHTFGWPPPWLIIGGLGIGLALVMFVVIPVIAAILAWLGGAAAAQAGIGASWLTGLDLARIVTDAVASWFDGHTAGLGVSADLLITLWWITVGSVFALAWLFGSRGAKVTWVLLGAACAWMTWTVTEPPAQAAAAGIVGFWWAIGAVFALSRSAIRVVTHSGDKQPEMPDEPREGLAQRRNRQQAADLLGALGEVFAGEGADPRAVAIAEDARGLSRALLPAPRQYGPQPSEDENPERKAWRKRLTRFITTADRGRTVEVHHEIASIMEAVLTDFAANAYLGSLHDADPVAEPLEELAHCAAWMVRTGQTQEAFTLLDVWWRRTRRRWSEQNPDGAPLDAAAAVAALDRAWPSDFLLTDRAEIRTALTRAWMPASVDD